MYDFTGCECPICHQLFRPEDDLVVCPDCGAPYHRSCYEKEGHCVYSARHGADFEWTPPHKPEAKASACAVCGTENPTENRYCKNCGVPLDKSTETKTAAAPHVPAEKSAKADPSHTPSSAAAHAPAGGQDKAFDYSKLYNSTYTPPEDAPFGANPYVSIDPNENVEGIPAAEWAAYIGPSSSIYLLIFKQMEMLRRKVSFSFSAMLFGPFYYIYRKAWKPALVFGLAACLLRIPVFLAMLQATGSALTAGISVALLENLQLVCSVLNYAIMAVSGLYGFYLYKRSAAEQIRHIQQQYPDTKKRSFVLNAQGGTSIAAVIVLFLAFMALIYIGMLLFIGPNISALANLVGYSLS